MIRDFAMSGVNKDNAKLMQRNIVDLEFEETMRPQMLNF